MAKVMYNMPFDKATAKAKSLKFKGVWDAATKGIPEPDYFFADSNWNASGRSMWTIKLGENNLDKIEQNLSKTDPEVDIKVKAGKATLDYTFGKYNIRFIASNKKSAKAADAKTTAMQERASAWIFRRVLNDNVRYKAWTDIKLDKKYSELEAIYPGVEEEWLKVFYAQQARMLTEFQGESFHEFNRDGGFMDYISDIVRSKFGISKKDTWNPADIWCIKDEAGVMRTIDKTIDGNGSQTILELNAVLRKLYTDRKVVGVSLKKVSGGIAKYEEYNIREDGLEANYNFKTARMTCPLAYKNTDGRIGQDSRIFVEGQEGVVYNFQIKGNDSTKFSNLKWEPTETGAAAARMGKAPVDMVKKLLEDNKVKFESDHKKYPTNATEFNEKKTQNEYKKLFQKLRSNQVETEITSVDDFLTNMQQTYANKPEVANSKCMQMKFLEVVLDMNDEKRDEFMTDMVFIAAKKGKRFGPFGKLY